MIAHKLVLGSQLKASLIERGRLDGCVDGGHVYVSCLTILIEPIRDILLHARRLQNIIIAIDCCCGVAKPVFIVECRVAGGPNDSSQLLEAQVVVQDFQVADGVAVILAIETIGWNEC